MVAFSVGEEELAGMDTKPLVGQLAAWNYFESVDTPENKAFIGEWHKFTKNPKRVTNDPMEAHYIGFNMWVKAVEAARHHRSGQGARRDDRHQDAEPHRRDRRRCCPTTTSPSRCSSAKSMTRASSTWCGRRKGVIAGDAWSKFLEGSKD